MGEAGSIYDGIGIHCPSSICSPCYVHVGGCIYVYGANQGYIGRAVEAGDIISVTLNADEAVVEFQLNEYPPHRFTVVAEGVKTPSAFRWEPPFTLGVAVRTLEWQFTLLN